MKTATQTKKAPTSKQAKEQKTAQLKKGAKGMEVTAKKPKKEKAPLYLVDGLTGKQLMSSKIATNNAHKSEQGSISYCIKRLLQFNDGFLNSFKGYNEADIKPSNLLPLLKETEAKNGKFSVWLTMQLVSRYYKLN